MDIEYEVIVKYNSDVKRLENELNIFVEILSPTYAIITSTSQADLDRLIDYPEIEYVEKPFILEAQDTQSFSSTGITSFKRNTNLNGEGTILGIIDSGIDHTLPIFKFEDGTSKILYYWDQSIDGNPPTGFNHGTVYSAGNINEAPVQTTSMHGTHVAGIAASIANKASIIAVRVGRRQVDTFSKSTEFMRAIKFILDISLELRMPVAINISYGSNEGSHRGLSLFEQYIDDMSLFWKNNIVVAAGNNASKGSHKRIQLKNGETQEVEFVVGANEKILNLNIWPNYVDEFSVLLRNPSNRNTQELSRQNPNINNRIGTTTINGVFYEIPPYALLRRVTIQMSSALQITPGIWTIVFIPKDIVEGTIDMYLPTVEGLSKDTRFLEPSEILTVTVPGTASQVITVGSFNSRTDVRSSFSGEGDFANGIYKPDILAPGEDIISYLPGGTLGALTGTSMATPHVTGVCSLLMQWGIVDGNDPFLYSQKTRSMINRSAKRSDNRVYPNSSYGYGLLNLNNLDLEYMSRSLDRNGNYRFENSISESLLVSHSPEFSKEIANFPYPYNSINLSELYTLMFFESLKREYVEAILRLDSVYIIENVVPINPLGQITRGTENGVTAKEDIGVNFFKTNPNLTLLGAGTLIAIIDTGIDYLHKDFIYPDGTSKIRYLWDQSKEGKPPNGFFIGTEYTREDINKAINENDSSLSEDEEGHGTMISGICAGLGSINKEYEGIAPEAELVVVKLAKINGFYTSAMLETAISYVYEIAKNMQMPTIINVSMGSNLLAGYASNTKPKKTYFSNGISIVAAAGNEGNTQTHVSGHISRAGEVVDVELEIVEDENNLIVEIWMSRPDRINLIVISPSGEESKIVDLSNYDEVKGIFDLENTQYFIRYSYPTSYSGQEHTTVTLKGAKKGIWKFRLEGAYISSGLYNIYLPNRVFLNPGTKFKESNPAYTINYLAVRDDVITIGTYDSINKSIWPASSRGPNIIDTMKPDVVAPGVNIIAPYPKDTYATVTGSSAAGAHASGVVSLFYQYTIAEDFYRNKGFMQKVRTYMQGGATRLKSVEYPNTTSGYGILDFRGMFEQLK
ncbi:bifunctional germination protease/germinant receptor pseudoprotease CspBA [Paraclostridium bifermentans]|uniref:bifunctional germination protease/germinant receptor pseudoprotease CspBA n=1 Tax=Paraclostridium bifermentans TaxID=1490 RepID=UPI0011DDE51D|nr:bifunctional germination protease/germinant receptor pseudoprotease CspBA [Paraclostridium bifermentans]